MDDTKKRFFTLKTQKNKVRKFLEIISNFVFSNFFYLFE